MKRSKVFWALVALFAGASLLPAVSTFASWEDDGSVVCSAENWQECPAIISDGANGAIIVWHDLRPGEYNDIYAQRMDASGDPLWTADGVAVCTADGNQLDPRIVPDGSGGAVITWRDYRTATDFDIYVQRVDASGTVLWTEDGVAVCTASEHQFGPDIASDGAGGAFIAWYDFRPVGTSDIYAQRVDAFGTPVWTADGEAICTISADQKDVRIIADGSGGAILAWHDARAKGIYAQRLDASGTALWTDQGVAVCTASGEQRFPVLVSDGAGGAIITWRDYRSLVDYDVYAQRVTAAGVASWTADGVAICTASGHQQDPEIEDDGNGGAIIVWQDARSTGIYAQRIDTLGAVSWTADGVAVCTASGIQLAAEPTTDGEGGAIITWRDHRGTGFDVYAQRLDETGTPLWTADGVAICTAIYDQRDPQIVSDGAGGAITSWYDYRMSGSYDIYAHRVGPDGTTDVVFASASASVRNGCVVLSWETAVDVPVSSFVVERSDYAEGGFVALNVPVFTSDGAGDGAGFLFICTDNTVQQRKTYWYRIVLRGATGDEVHGPIRVYVSPSALAYRVHQSYPNPFNPVCTIRFEVPSAGRVSLRVFDATGALVKTLVDGWREPAEYSEVWDGRDDRGRELPSGVYFYQLEAMDFQGGRKIVLLR